ncbi:MAG: 3'-5' exonuclease [Lachnospiraceae bacterium]|nr:3'-5' exonuclease [Robinsoniella sp.]MDY3766803.1 3'-5' exonuclease [Lachnospiraceae bacterium]
MAKSYVVVDLETTGLSPEKDRILEIGAVKLEDEKITDSFQCFVNCHRKLSEVVTNLTGITQEMCESGVEEEQALEAFLQFAGDQVLIGHNLPFDFGFLKWSFMRQKISFEREGIDTLKIARSCLKDLPSRKLEALCCHYGISQEKKHRALDDACATAELFCCMRRQFGEKKPEYFQPLVMQCKVKKQSCVTESQKRYLIDLIKYHRIQIDVSIDHLTKSEASRLIDHIILQYGRKKVNHHDEVEYEKEENGCGSTVRGVSGGNDCADDLECSSEFYVNDLKEEYKV